MPGSEGIVTVATDATVVVGVSVVAERVVTAAEIESKPLLWMTSYACFLLLSWT